MKTTEYYLKGPAAQQPKAITKRRDTGELINLKGEEVTEKIAAFRNRPERTVTVRGATQEDLRYFLEQEDGNWERIIGVRDVDAKKLAADSKPK